MQLYYKTKIYRIRMIILIILCATTINIMLPISVSASELQPIMGETIANKEEMLEYYKNNSSISYPKEYIEKGIDLEKFLNIMIEEAHAEGVRADVAFAHILVETDWLKFNGEVSIAQNNFGGLKDQEGNYLSFDSIEEGIRVNIQLLKGYASSEPLNQDKITFLYDLINPKGMITYVEDLGNSNWSVDSEYATSIKQRLEEIISIKTILTPEIESQIASAIPIDAPTETEDLDELQDLGLSAPLETKIDTTSKSKSGDIILAEVKTLSINGSGYVGNIHRIRSFGTSKNGVLYQFWIKDLSANMWTMIQDYSKSSASWTPIKPGKYLYGVHIKDEKSNKRLDAHLYQEITVKDMPVEVKTLTIDGSGYIGGSHRIRSYGESANGVLHQFWIKDLSTNKWTMIQDYSKSSASWTPIKPGKYLYGVHIKDEKSKARLDTHLYKKVTIKSAEVKTLTIDGSGYVGGSHRIRSYGGSGNGVLYQFWVKDLSTNKWTMIQDYSKSSAFWTPTKAGKYLYGVHIKDEKSNARLDGHLYKEVTIKSSEVKSLIVDVPAYVGGRYRIRCYGESANGVLYQFWIKDLSTNKWTMIRDYSKSSALWIPTKAGKYLYGVHIKDELSNKRLDAHLYKEITIIHDDFQDYINLLNMFPKEKQGNSLEPTLKPPGPSEQPMTYGLVLSSESLHYKSSPNTESAERIKNAVKWIVENADANQDGNPGWGLPQSWDAFSDGTINPENHPYTITTAIVLQGLLDAISIEELWTDEEEKEIKDLISEVSMYWLENVYVGDDEMGYLGYSEEPTDMINTPNVSGMFLSSLVRALKESDDIFAQEEKEFVTKRVYAITNKLIDTVILIDEKPYWEYKETNNQGATRSNDLVHHIYILWGIEEYRENFDDIKIPFTLEDSISSIDIFCKDNSIYSYPQNNTGSFPYANDRPSNLWGAGMMLSFYSKYGQTMEADKCLKTINGNYGSAPNLTMWPLEFSSDKNLYARYVAHVLFGLSYKNFY